MDLVVKMRFGSHLYGTATPESDLDLKGVYLPSHPFCETDADRDRSPRSSDKSSALQWRDVDDRRLGSSDRK
jgi:RNA repair pathway DNA polymerase beta family